jgi:hypothetical protein
LGDLNLDYGKRKENNYSSWFNSDSHRTNVGKNLQQQCSNINPW